MKNLMVAEHNKAGFAYLGPYQEIAVHVRNLLRSDYAVVASSETDGIRVRAVSSRHVDTTANLPEDLLAKIGYWGPGVVDDARLIVVPVIRGDHVRGLLIGYASESGRFTGEHLEKLMEYSHVAAGIFGNTCLEDDAARRTDLSIPELLHFSRLITIGELSACFAHEVTNPLMLIRGHLRFIKENLESLPRDHPLHSNFEVIDRSSRRIEELAKRMLDFSRKSTRRAESCDLNEVISDALRLVQPYFRRQNVDVQVHVDRELSAAHADPWQLVQAIVNLLQNAADAMSDSGKRVLSIAAKNEDGFVRITIADTGKGIADEHVSQIFDPFFTTKGERGTGLGLYITKQVIDEHDGTITVHTGERGTTFVLSLPL